MGWLADGATRVLTIHTGGTPVPPGVARAFCPCLSAVRYRATAKVALQRSRSEVPWRENIRWRVRGGSRRRVGAGPGEGCPSRHDPHGRDARATPVWLWACQRTTANACRAAGADRNSGTERRSAVVDFVTHRHPRCASESACVGHSDLTHRGRSVIIKSGHCERHFYLTSSVPDPDGCRTPKIRSSLS